MGKNVSRILLILIVVGIAMAGLGFVTGGRGSVYVDRGGVHVASAEVKRLQVDEQLAFTRLEIEVSAANVRVVSGDAFQIDAEYSDGLEPGYALEGNVLRIFDSGKQSSSFRIGIMSIHLDNYVYVTLPKDMKLERAKVSSDVGNMTLRSIQAEQLETRGSAGSLDATDVSCEEWIASTDVGDIDLSGIVCEKRIQITSSAGRIVAQRLVSADASCRTDVGDIKLDGLETGALSVRSSAGRIVAQGALGGVNRFESDVGAIDVESSYPKSAYQIEANSDVGRVSITPPEMVADVSGIQHQLVAKSSVGSIQLKFSE